MRNTGQKAEPYDPTDEAAWWVARLQSADATDEDRAAFDAWLARDSRNAEAYNEFCDVWSQMKDVPLAPQKAGGGRAKRAAKKTLLTLAAAAVMAAGAFHFGYLDRLRADHSTATGEVRSITLADGSTVTLNTDSSIQVDYSPAERRITLLRGEAFFKVARNTARPFTVTADGLSATALGTAYDVRRAGPAGSPAVEVQEGRVEVRRLSDRVVLKAREAAVLTPEGRLLKQRADVDRDLAWRDGQLVFSGRPLREVLGELDRYHPGKILLLDDALGDHRVSGIFDVADTENALSILEQRLPIQVDHVAGWLVLVRPE